MPPFDNLNTIWTTWNSANTAATTTEIWTQWVTASASTQITVNGLAPREPTAGQRAEWKRVEDERKAAREKAKELLLGHLTPEQRAEYEKDGHFHVETAEGQRRYRLRPGSPPVRVQGEDGRRWSYCIHPRDQSFPAEDVTLALKLMLETEEEAFLRTANASVAYA